MLSESEKFQKLQMVIRSDPRDALKLSDFVVACNKLGLKDVDHREVARALHKAGLVLFVEHNHLPEANDTLLLHTGKVKEIMDHVLLMRVCTTICFFFV